MAGDELTPSENAILIVLMAEAREVLNTELRDRYGVSVPKASREKYARLHLVVSRKAGPTFALELDDKGWAHVHHDLAVRSNGSSAQAAAVTAVQAALRERVLERSGCRSLGELFARTDLRGASPLSVRLRHTYDALAGEPGGWVSLTRLRPFFADVPRAAVDDALRELSREPGVALVPESNRKTLTDADRAAAVHVGVEDKHLLAIGER